MSDTGRTEKCEHEKDSGIGLHCSSVRNSAFVGLPH